MLKKLVSALGSLVAAPLGAGCNKYGDVSNRTFKAKFVDTDEMYRELWKPEEFRGLDGMWVVRFADPLRFKRIDEAVQAFGYLAVTRTEPAYARSGKFAMRATLRKGYTGGPPGSATELFVEYDDVHLVERLSPPKAPPGKKGVLPGQAVVRRIADGELARLDDRYLIELPANKTITIWLEPFPRDYVFKLEVMKDGVTIPTGPRDFDTPFQTNSTGTYEIRVLPAESATQLPDRYFFIATWGDELGTNEVDADRKITWKPIVRAAGRDSQR